MSDASERYSSNQGEDTDVPMPVETGSSGKGANKWAWQIETTSMPQTAKGEESAGKWVWQIETTPRSSATKESANKWAWQIETTPLPSSTSVEENVDPWYSQIETMLLPSTDEITSSSARLQKVQLEAIPAMSQEMTLKLPAPGKAVSAKQTRVPSWLLALVTALFAAFLLLWDLPNRTLNVGNWPGSFGLQLGLGAALLAILAGMVYLLHLQGWPSFKVKKWILAPVLFLLLIAGVLLPQAIITLSFDAQQFLIAANGQNFVVYKQSDVTPYFSLAYPSDWPSSVKVNNGGLTAILFIVNDSNTSNTTDYFVVLRHFLDPHESVSLQDDLKSYLQPLCNGCAFVPQQSTTQGPWQVIRYQDGNEAGIAWIRDINGQRVILTGLTDPAAMTQDEPIFTTIVQSWSPDLLAKIPSTGPTPTQERQTISDRVLPWICGLLPFLLGLLALPVLLWQRKRPGTIVACALFFIVLGMLQFAYYLQEFIAPGISQVQLDFYVSSVLLTIAVGSLIFLCWLLIKRQITRENSSLLILLLSLNADLAFISVVFYLFSQLSLPPGIPPLAAQLLATSKVWLQVGLLHIGVPLIITAFMLQVTYCWGSRKQENVIWTYGSAAAVAEED